MNISRTLGLAAVLLASVAATGAQAVVVGTPGIPGQASGFPFGANPGGRYQQLFTSDVFTGGGVSITGLSFFNTSSPAATGAALATGPFTISLSTTSASLDFSTPFASNVGPDSTVVFTGALPALSGGRLNIAFATPFTFQPGRGNLLLDVQSPSSTTPAVFFDNSETLTSSSLFGTGGVVPTPSTFGLVTDITAVPEPASMMLLGTGLAGLAGLRRRRVASV